VSERVVRVAEWAVGREGTLVTLGLGSCVAIVLFDAQAGAGGLAHVLLPSPTLSRDREHPGKFPESAVPLLVEELAKLGAARDRLRARLVGGASMFANLTSPSVAQMGERNVLASRDALKKARIPIVAEDTGSDYGRSVYLHLPSGKLAVRSVARGTREL
jgi:chemotaxis protein CheD